ncbi:hypothetical protein N0O92_05355 [Alkalihalobacillus sp. MEB130]|uniref:hypothetical protein n=1 Tax=Alkalihalobacillus sp. MEB130 TaxID=2976704 RepID=UPI0028DFF8BE|nr:hypothetical protein [Alkalihalobacillus sp. MEB130]MDT8859654.1 hypothetical protein [Alkalihalobacillus sp. MEB130]
MANKKIEPQITVELAKKLLNDKTAYLTDEGRRRLEEIVRNEEYYNNQIIN